MKAYKDLLNVQKNRSGNIFLPSDPIDPQIYSVEPENKAFGPSELQSSEIDVVYSEKLGGGNYGNVFVGVCRGQAVAVKILNNDLSAVVVDAFKKEASLLSQLFHPNICLFMGACYERGKMMLVSELMEGGTLQQLFDSKEELSQFTMLRMARDIARGMCWLHARPHPIIHRDLKPANCLLSRSFVVKICDFGFSEILPPTLSLRDSGKGATGKGSPLWMAPEVLLKQDFSTSADVYSFSVMLWQTQTRSRPWGKISDLEKLKREVCVMHNRPVVPETTLPEVRQLMADCWAPVPAARPSFRDILLRIEQLMIHVAIKDVRGREFWGGHFRGREFVQLGDFIRRLSDFNGPDLEAAEDDRALQLACFKAVFGEAHGFINLESFGTVLSYLPLTPTFAADLVSLLAKPWFHGSVSTYQAEESVKGRRVGTFLLRFSNSRAGVFTITKLEETGPVHQRIDVTPEGKLSVSGAATAFSTFEELLQSEAVRLGCIHAAPGSPYTKIFDTDERKAKYKYQTQINV